jgi:hypothetical protein
MGLRPVGGISCGRGLPGGAAGVQDPAQRLTADLGDALVLEVLTQLTASRLSNERNRRLGVSLAVAL